MGNYVTVLTLMDFFSKGIFSIVYGEVTGTRLTFLHLKIIELANCFRLLQQATQYIVLKRREIHQVSATSAQLFGLLDLDPNELLPFLMYSFYQLLTPHQEMGTIIL